MGLQRINSVVAALQEAQIRAQRGFPVGKMPYLTTSVAGVCIELIQAHAVTLAVRIFTPLEHGGAACEDTAMQAAEILAQMGAACQIQSCSFDGKTGLFSMAVLATFKQEETE